jgi:hypothetical protein
MKRLTLHRIASSLLLPSFADGLLLHGPGRELLLLIFLTPSWCFLEPVLFLCLLLNDLVPLSATDLPAFSSYLVYFGSPAASWRQQLCTVFFSGAESLLLLILQIFSRSRWILKTPSVSCLLSSRQLSGKLRLLTPWLTPWPTPSQTPWQTPLPIPRWVFLEFLLLTDSLQDSFSAYPVSCPAVWRVLAPNYLYCKVPSLHCQKLFLIQ